MLSLILLSLWMVALASGTSEVVVDDADLMQHLVAGGGESSPSYAGASRAARWLLDQRREESGWGSFTPRAVVALALAVGPLPLPDGEWELITKQLDIFISLEVGGSVTSLPPITSRLALFVNALLAVCRDPRSFHGRDLVHALRTQTDQEVRRTGERFPLPAVFIPLCLTGETTHADLSLLAKMYQTSTNKTDLQALQLLAMSCITSQRPFASFRPTFIAYLRDFASRFLASLQHNTTDVYTKALAVQAIHSGGGEVGLLETASLLSDQMPDGSFERSLLATYYAIPALLASSMLRLADTRRCSDERKHEGPVESSPRRVGSKVVHLSLWIGEGMERDTHTVTVAAGDNDTLLDVMLAAQERNDVFRFSYDESRSGIRVYSLAGVPNDAEREVSWRLYIQRSGSLQEVDDARVDKVHPASEDSIVFWLKRNSRK